MDPEQPNLPLEAIAAFCCAHRVCELALFGSAVRGQLEPESDLDLLVEFKPGARVGLLKLARMSRELSSLLGRNVDLVPKDGLKSLIRDDILAERKVIFAA